VYAGYLRIVLSLRRQWAEEFLARREDGSSASASRAGGAGDSTTKHGKKEKEDGERRVGEIETKEDARCLDGGQEQERRCLRKHSFSP
jgi:hypothetical protein